jgi:hypothetical protein
MLPDTGRVLVHERVDAGGGGTKDVYEPGPELPCRLAPISSATGASEAGAKIHEDATHVVTFPATTVIKADDRAEVAGTVYIVLGVREYGSLTFSRRAQVKPL